MTTRPTYAADALGIGIATGVYGISFGVLAVAAGLTEAQACAMSLLVFTGGSQFAAVGVLAAGGAAATAVANAMLLAVRNMAYGLSLSSLLRGALPRRAVAAQLVIDETTAMARAQDDEHAARGAFWLTGGAVFVCWNAGTLAGALAGSGLGDPSKSGFDAMFPAAFLALLAPQLRQPGAPAAALAGALIAVVLLPLTPAGVPVIAASLGVLAALLSRASAGPRWWPWRAGATRSRRPARCCSATARSRRGRIASSRCWPYRCCQR